jgi:glycosyltransferase involved in cell wall biosynthesis
MVPREPGLRRRVALVCHHLGNLWQEQLEGQVGGLERQYDLIARHLAPHADVRVVTARPPRGWSPPPGLRVETYEAPRGRGPTQALALAHGLRDALRRADPEACLQSGAGLETFITARACQRRGIPFAYHWASDADLAGARAFAPAAVLPLYRWARRHADLELVQTEAQMALLPTGRRAELFPNLLDTGRAWRPSWGDAVLWVGTIRPDVKRPDRFLALARRLPHRKFIMVGELRGDEGFRRRFLADAALPNLEVAGFQPPAALPDWFARARTLVNTSDVEGFPNTFLEAAASQVPIVSLHVDPNGMLEGGAGRFAKGDEAGLAPAVESMYQDAVWERHRQACRLVAARHGPDAAARRLAGILEQLCAASSGS